MSLGQMGGRKEGRRQINKAKGGQWNEKKWGKGFTQTGRQTGRQTDRQTNRQTDRTETSFIQQDYMLLNVNWPWNENTRYFWSPVFFFKTCAALSCSLSQADIMMLVTVKDLCSLPHSPTRPHPPTPTHTPHEVLVRYGLKEQSIRGVRKKVYIYYIVLSQ